MAKRKMTFEYGKYFLMKNTAYMDYVGNDKVEVGKIVDSFANEDVMYIYYNRNAYSENGYHMTVIIHIVDGKDVPVIYISDMYRACLYEHTDVFLALALHEYGHYIHGDFERTGITNRQIQEERDRCIRNGLVYDIERKADAFAVKYVGKAAFLSSLDYLIELRRQRNDPYMDMAIKEFELRKRAVKNM